MKHLYRIFFLLSVLFFVSCDDMLDNIRPYLDKGETVYVGKADTLYVNAGHNRVELVIRLKSGYTQTKCQTVMVDKNGEEKLFDYEIDRQNEEQYLNYIYDGLTEGQYDFYVTLFDAEGNKSLTETAYGYSYGDFYQSTLLNRRLELTYNEDKVVLKWMPIDDALYTIFSYTATDGSIKAVTVPVDENETEISDFKEGGSYSWKTAYKPTKTSLDIFFSNEGFGTFSN